MAHDWRPVLENDGESLYERLILALVRDIGTGSLRPGDRLPPQRHLADQLGLSVGTVTRAYVEAERRGLVAGHVGRGTFVAGDEDGDAEVVGQGQVVDLSVNVVPHQAAAKRLAQSLSTLKRHPDLNDAMGYAPPAGPERQRRAAAEWVRRVAGLEVSWQNLVMTSGAQQAMALAFGTICRAGDTVLCEDSTFYGMKSLAEHLGLTLRGVEMDGEGVIPERLEQAARETGARTAYLMPTIHNPTGRSMRPARRRDIVRVARKCDMWLVEDDNYAAFGPQGSKAVVPLTALAPERCFYLGGVSKSVAPGLRTGYLHCPTTTHLESILRTVRATVYAPSSLGGMFLADWIEDGSAFEVVAAVRHELETRAALAREILGPGHAGAVGLAPHFWLPCDELGAERLAGRALRAGVALTPPAAPTAPGTRTSGIRVCIGAAANTAQLAVGMERLRSALAEQEVVPHMEMI